MDRQPRELCAKYGCRALPIGDTIYCNLHHEQWCRAIKLNKPKYDDCTCHSPEGCR